MRDRLAEFFRKAAFYRYHPNFDRFERQYKLRLASGFSRSRDLMDRKRFAGVEIVRKSFKSKDNNIIYWVDSNKVVDWLKTTPSDSALKLRKLWNPAIALEKRFNSFCEALTEVGVSASGAQLAITS